MHETSNNKKLIGIAGLVIIVAAIGAAVALGSGKKETAEATPTPTAAIAQASTTPTPSGTVADATASPYKDGTYSATGAYRSPGGNQEIQISLTVKDGKITETSAVQKASDPDSEEYQDKFIAGYKSLVVGKSLDEVNLSKVSGSSLTGVGFNDAVNQIKSKAKA